MITKYNNKKTIKRIGSIHYFLDYPETFRKRLKSNSNNGKLRIIEYRKRMKKNVI